MADRINPKQRSANMLAIKGKNTVPELLVRKALHAAGFRFRLHRRDLPGTPDIVLPKYRTAIFVHGCFWHMHKACPDSAIPKSNTVFWSKKLNDNVARDMLNQKRLSAINWKVYVLWECELQDVEKNWLCKFKKFLQSGT